MGNLIKGKEIASKITCSLEGRVRRLKENGHTVSLTVILVGDDPASLKYDQMKGEAAKKIGMDFSLVRYAENSTTEFIVQEVNRIQVETKPSGLIVQLPLPKHIDTLAVLNTIDPAIDVDCLTYENIGRLAMNQPRFEPPTAAAIIKILAELHIKPVGKNVTIVGVGPLVGKPLAMMLMNARASVTTCNSVTQDLKTKCLQADIIISAVGKKNLIRGDMIKEGAIVIDAGVDFTDTGKVVGDVNVPEVREKAAYVTPTPGGVGPLTVVCLLENTVLSAERMNV